MVHAGRLRYAMKRRQIPEFPQGSGRQVLKEHPVLGSPVAERPGEATPRRCCPKGICQSSGYTGCGGRSRLDRRERRSPVCGEGRWLGPRCRFRVGSHRAPSADRTDCAPAPRRPVLVSRSSGRPILWAYALRRGGLKWPTWERVARARGRSVVWFLTVGSSGIADGVACGTAALRAAAGAASSDASGRGLWAYGFRQGESEYRIWTRIGRAPGRSMVWFLTVGSSRIADGVTCGTAALRAGADAASSDASGRGLWAYGFRRGESECRIWARIGRAPGRSTVWFLTVGSPRMADGVTCGTAALRAAAGAASSDAGGPVLWAYGSRRCGSKSLTGALVAGARGRRMAPGPCVATPAAALLCPLPGASRSCAVRLQQDLSVRAKGRLAARPTIGVCRSSPRWVIGWQARRRKFRGRWLKRVASNVLCVRFKLIYLTSVHRAGAMRAADRCALSATTRVLPLRQASRFCNRKKAGGRGRSWRRERCRPAVRIPDRRILRRRIAGQRRRGRAMPGDRLSRAIG